MNKWIVLAFISAVLFLEGCWTGPSWPDVRYAPAATRAPSVRVTGRNQAQRDAFCRVFRESGQFEDVDCSEQSNAEIVVDVRYTTLRFEHRVGHEIGLGLASLFNCIWLSGADVTQEHRARVQYRGRIVDLSASADAAMSEYMCFPAAGILSLLGTFWGPALGAAMTPSWEAIEARCEDAPLTTTGVAVGSAVIAQTSRDRSACVYRDRFVTEASARAALEMLPRIVSAVGASREEPADHSAQPAGVSAPTSTPPAPPRGRRRN